MLIGLLTTLLIIDGLFLILFILIQKGKGNMGLGALGGGAQTLFGGSGGQDLFQKITWVLGGIFMAGSLGLSILKSKGTSYGDYMSHSAQRPVLPMSRAAQQAKQEQQVPQVPVSQKPAEDAKPVK